MSGVTRGRWGAPLRAPRPADAADEATPLPRALQAARPCFAEIYGQHFDFVWRSLRHLGVAPPALDDAVQEVWLVVHRQLPQFEGRSKVTTWLFGVALNVARNQRRKARPSSGAEAAVDEMPSRAPDPEKLLVAQDAWLEVQRFLDMLDDVPRAIFVSALLENLSPAETADAMGLDVGLVYRRVRALRRAFARRLGRNEEGSQ
jgi:RNA polymerase sigma-70 factor (ECF subfamily)